MSLTPDYLKLPAQLLSCSGNESTSYCVPFILTIILNLLQSMDHLLWGLPSLIGSDLDPILILFLSWS